ncbi:MAG: MCE family protein [Planctomycetes bacterium]|nr:MCE family protein [Planctomycetota bacterium]
MTTASLRPVRDTVLGLFFFGVIILLILATVFLSERVYGATSPVYVLFDQAIGLRKGDPVQISGVNLGYVKSIELLTGDKIVTVPGNAGISPRQYHVKVRCELREKEIETILFFDDNKTVIEYASVLGGRVVSIDPGRVGTGKLIPKDVVLFGQVRRDPLAALSDLIEDNKITVKEAIEEIRNTFRDARTGNGLLAKVINDKAFADKFEKIVSDIERTTDSLAQARGALGKAISDPQVAAQFERIMNNITSVTDKINGSEGVIGKLINDKTWSDRVDKITQDIVNLTTKLNSTNGSLGKLINSDEAHDKLIRIEQQIEVALDKLNNGQGLLARLLNDKELSDDAKDFIHKLDDIVATIDRGEGTFGKLVKDDNLIRGIERLVRQISRSIEDAREAAPIATFSSVLFGAF